MEQVVQQRWKRLALQVVEVDLQIATRVSGLWIMTRSALARERHVPLVQMDVSEQRTATDAMIGYAPPVQTSTLR
jgi:hypothetical protein